MLAEDFFTAVNGPPLASNTAIAKDVAVYHQTLSPSYGVRTTFRKSATPVGGLAVSPAHIFAAQQDRAYLHVYSRLRGGQEAAVPMPEKIRCLALAGDVLIAGTAEGRLLLWETLSGRLITTPPCHVQAVSCLQTTSHHVLSGSDDSNVHVWSLSQLLALGGAGGASSNGTSSSDDPEPEHTLARHRAAVTALVVGSSASRDTSLCASASRDKTVVLWNYQTGVALRTLLFAAVPTCLALDPVARALYVATDDSTISSAAAAASSANTAVTAATAGHIFALELFGDKPLLGARGAEAASTAASITKSFGAVPEEAGPANCLSLSYDGATLLSGHPRGRLLQWNLGDGASSNGAGSTALPVELANLNAAITNVVFVAPAALTARVVPRKLISAQTVVKPSQAGRSYSVAVKFDEEPSTDFDALLHEPGFPGQSLQKAIMALQQSESQEQVQEQMQEQPEPASEAASSEAGDAAGDSKLRRQNAELLEIINEQQALYQQALQRCADLEAARS
ncbi:ribosomal assembly complex component [Grosmannia clavigera kw1407]|uniref:Pre-rRNA-processing protein IPI3 n=1 Tax=Grosmannia clavigera (strain kw1407 / UAMH 11150) TaxID=655863 RepID=F0XJ33_GROCL|nr:ribosomal assembly complex component [Grosmannia clavigera kw1407]EFX02134.1 ribosomal assembly complex component [Grosmannia clavigera kw1407]